VFGTEPGTLGVFTGRIDATVTATTAKGCAMPGVFKKAAAWLGLLDSDSYEYEQSKESFNQPVTRPKDAAPEQKAKPVKAKEQQAATEDEKHPRRQLPGEETVAANANDIPDITPDPKPQPKTPELVRPVLMPAQQYSDVIAIAERYNGKTPVAMTLTSMAKPEAKRIIDFASGLVFGTHGAISKIGPMVFLLTPEGVRVSAEDKARIIADMTIKA
jgi:cell division inhibitor SepF